MIKLPRQKRIWRQENDGEVFGSLESSFNLNLQDNRGSIRANRSKEVYNTGNDADFGLVTDIVLFDTDNDLAAEYVVRAAGDGTVGGGIFFGGANPSDTFTENTDSGVPTASIIDRGGLAVFNNKLYGTDSNNLRSFAKGASSWSSISSGLALSEHHMAVFKARLYITDNDDTVLSMSAGESLATSGVNTLDLSGFENTYITCILAGDESMYVGTFNQAGQLGTVFEWDGSTENTPTTKYTLDSIGVLAGIVKDGVPYFVDVRGRLIALSGGRFVEVARLPFDREEPLFDVESVNSSAALRSRRIVHPNGMTLIDGKINILFDTDYINNTASQDERVPSGVWEYTEENGLYHKNSVSYSDVGGTMVTDYGQSRIAFAGALQETRNGNSDADRNGTYLFGARHYTDASTATYGLFTNDSIDTTQKAAWLRLPWLSSGEITDQWSKFYSKHRKLINSTDKIVVKYRTEKTDPTEVDITWVDTTSFTTTGSIGDFVVGDEVTVVQGTGAGVVAHITALSGSGTVTVTIDETATGVTTGTAKARFQKWKKADSFSDQNVAFGSFNIGDVDTEIQIKIWCLFTGENELDEFVIVNKSSTEAK